MTTAGDNRSMSATADRIYIDHFIAHLTLAGRSPDTIRSYRQALGRASKVLPHGLCAVGDEIAAWLASLRTANTRFAYAVALNSFYRWCVKRRHITCNPMAELEMPRKPRGVPRPISNEQLRRILTEAVPKVQLWSTVAAYAGARCCEIARLRREDVTEQLLYLHGKGDKERTVPTHPEVWAAVANLPAGPVAGGRRAKTIGTQMRTEYDRLGMPEVTAHQLRHWYGTHVQAATGDSRVTQELLGHESLASTQIYTAVASAAKRAAVLALPAITGLAATAPEGA